MTTLHAQTTNTIVHAAKAAGETNTVLLTYNLVDEAGNRYIDEAGSYYVTIDKATVPVLHAPPTDTLVHAGGING